MSAVLAPDKILKEMADLWADLGSQKDHAPGAGVLRACSLTLAVVGAPEDDPARLGETLAALLPQHPARTIVIRLSPGQPLGSRVSSQCWKPFGQRQQICCEQIEITASEEELEDVASVILPIAAPDLPLVVWCRDEALFGGEGFEQLAALAARVIVNTHHWGDARGAIARLQVAEARGFVLGDLSWTRLTFARENLSQVFENRSHAARMAEISNVRVTCGQRIPVMAFYLGAWLTDCLKRAGARPKLTLHKDPKGEDGRLVEVDLSGPDFQVTVARAGETLTTTVNGLANCTNLPTPSEYHLMKEELAITGHDLTFERVLSSAGRLTI
jgi:glucose-6-phosphate dehydrogenase assembly protein OpcA